MAAPGNCSRACKATPGAQSRGRPGPAGYPQPTTAAGSPPGPSTCFCQGFPPPRRPLGFPVSTNQGGGSGSEGTAAHTASNSHLRPVGGRHHVGTYLLTRALAAPTAPAPSGGLRPHRLSAGDGPSPPVPPSKAAGTVPSRLLRRQRGALAGRRPTQHIGTAVGCACGCASAGTLKEGERRNPDGNISSGEFYSDNPLLSCLAGFKGNIRRNITNH